MTNPVAVADERKVEILLEAYRKHAAELLAIEEAQQTLTTLILAILGAGGTFVASMTSPLTMPARWGLTIIVISTVLIGFVYTLFRSRARQTTRALLVRCEEALGFQTAGVYIEGQPLYREELRRYPSSGAWLNLIYALVIAVGIGFLVVVWSQ
jgi:hypothetical protein